MPIEFRILGPLEVLAEGTVVPLGSPKQRALLGLLLVHANETVSRERLIEELWGEAPPASVASELHVYLSRLRRLLETAGAAGALVREPYGYRLAVAAEHLDASRFEALARSGRQALAAGDAALAGERLREALALWHGPALADLPAEPFAVAAAARLEEQRVSALEHRLEADLALGRARDVVDEIGALVAEHPYREHLCALLMLALYRGGRQAEALDVHQQARRRLVEELGIEPGSELQQLQQAILRQDPVLAAAAAQLPAPMTAEAQPRPLREERKVITVLVCELAGAADLVQRPDLEREQKMLRRCFEEVGRVIVDHGGVAEKGVGYAAIGLFGLPAAHEDDALRAVRAAAEIVEQLPVLAEEIGVAVVVRAGINTGEVVAGGAETLPMGATVTGAAHLQQLAESGEILLGPYTVRLLGAAVEAEPLATPPGRGVAGARSGFRLRGLVEPLGRQPLLFVGRERELTLLQDAFQRSVEGRSSQLFTLLGPAGIGKSRLAAEFEESLGTSAKVAHGRCLSYGRALTYWPLMEVLRELGEPAREAHERLVGGGATSPQELAWTVLRALEAAAETEPLVVVLDDLHWGEPALFDLLDLISEPSSEAPILLLCLARPELLDRRSTWGGGKPNATSLMLEPLSRPDCEMLSALLHPLEPDQRERVVALAAGNPLFVEELTHFVAEGGGDRQLPPRIQALLQARLDLLTEPQRLMLGCASVEGTVFHHSSLERLLPEQLLAELPSQLSALQRTWLIRPSSAELEGEPAYRFRHQLIRDTAYAATPKKERARLHERLAAWLAEHHGGRADLDDIAAHHLEQSALYRRELGSPDPGLEARAADALAAAAGRAYRRVDVRAAVDVWEHALALLSSDDPRVPALELSLALVLPWLGRFDDTQRLLERAVSQTADPAVAAAARLCVLLARLHSAPEGVPAAIRQECAEAIPLFEQADDHDKLMLAWAVLGEAEFAELQVEAAARAWTTAAAEARRAGDRAFEMVIRGMEADRVGVERTPLPALADELGRLADEYPGEPLCEVARDAARGTVAYQQGRLGEGRDLFEAAIAQAHRIGQVEFAAVHRAVGIAYMELGAGNLDDAERHARAGIDELQALNEHAWLAWALTVLAEIRLEQGRDEEALELADRADRHSPHDRRILVLGNAVRARALAQRGAVAAAKAAAAEAIATAQTTDSMFVQFIAQHALAETLAASGELETALATARETADLCRAFGHTARGRRLLALAEQIESSIAARRGERAAMP